MLIEIIIFLLFGILAGTITGLIPGIHINLISASLITLTTSIFIQPIYSLTFIVSMSITHTFIDFIPSIFLGCPDTDTELGILPGHKLLKEKRGFEAVYLSNIGSIIAIILTVIIVIPSIIILKNFYSNIEKIIPYLLILTCILLILSEKNKLKSSFIILLTGFLGIITNQMDVNNSLLPLLTGLFGSSNIILSIKNKTKIPKQIITIPKIKLKNPVISAFFSAPFCSLLPSFGSGQAAIIGNLIKKNSQEQFLVLLGIINTLVMTFSFISLYAISKTRTGSALAIQNIINIIQTKHLILIIIILLISGTLSFFLTIKITKLISKKIHNINYKKISYITLLILLILILVITKIEGLIILTLATLTGIYCIKQNVKRTNMMGCLIIPTIIWLL